MTFITAEETIQHIGDLDIAFKEELERRLIDHTPGIELAIQMFYRSTYVPEERREILMVLLNTINEAKY